MSEDNFRAVYRGGLWWVQRSHDGAWSISAGPYKFRTGAENRVGREVFQLRHDNTDCPQEQDKAEDQ